ncbi:MAG: DNA polymerase III subunit delta [Planctomycetaceae bacterium]|nr:DNA polymerase III subunit delta [Planctomycetaceae bacterium]
MAKKTKPEISEDRIPALNWMADPEKFAPQTICAVFGEESFLRRSVLSLIPSAVARSLALADPNGQTEELEPAEFDGNSASWRNIFEELSTFSMFGPAKRLVILNDADDFLSKNREVLEKFAEDPLETGILVLELKSFPSNTKLFKLVEGNGLLIDCGALHEKTELPRWVCERAAQKHHFKIQPGAASLLITQIGTEMGLLDQELARLALTITDGKPITEAQIRQNSGTWRMQTVWTLADCILDGNAKDALFYLGQLLEAGEVPIVILAQLSSNFRRLATACQLIVEEERAGRRPDLENALSQAGVNRYFLQKASAQLKRLGRERARMLFAWLTELDFALKGASALPERLLLERLILRLTMPRSSTPGKK